MKTQLELVPSGGVTAPAGFTGGAVAAGIKNSNKKSLDLGILCSARSCQATAVFTTNHVKATSVLLNQARLKNGRAAAVVMNSGCANAFTGEQGMADAVEMAALAAIKTGISPEDVLVASTGVIGTALPMERIRAGITAIQLTSEGGHDLARAIMTTDTHPKEIAVKAGDFTIGGMVKGSGMIHPNMATLLCFLTTDAPVELSFLKRALHNTVNISFNMVAVDNDGSTNDTVLIMANGMAGGEMINGKGKRARDFQAALDEVCRYLARETARDGEGATKFIEVKVGGARNVRDARRVARTIAGSMLVKSAVYGSDPNWGRIVAAAGRSGARVDADKLEVFFGGIAMARNGGPVPFDRKEATRYLEGKEIAINLDLHLGKAEATAWGCDLTETYVKINAEYTT
jgi:glutamate N-acetyltransferase/amino-acid N-acetyltransferase